MDVKQKLKISLIPFALFFFLLLFLLYFVTLFMSNCKYELHCIESLYKADSALKKHMQHSIWYVNNSQVENCIEKNRRIDVVSLLDCVMYSLFLVHFLFSFSHYFVLYILFITTIHSIRQNSYRDGFLNKKYQSLAKAQIEQ